MGWNYPDEIIKSIGLSVYEYIDLCIENEINDNKPDSAG